MMNKLQKIQQKLYPAGLVAFYAGLLIEILILIIDKSNYINPVEGQLFRVTFLLFVMKATVTKYNKNDLLLAGIFAVIGVISWRVTGRNEILRMTIFVVSCRDVEIGKLWKTLFYGTLAGSIVLILLSVTGIYGGLTRTANYDGAMSTRYCFGMGNPNAFHIMIAMLTLLGVYIYRKKVKFWHGAVLLTLDIILYFLCRSLMGTAAMAAAVIWTLVLNYRKDAGKGTKHFFLMELVSFAGIGFTFAGAIENKGLIKWIDAKFLTGRIATIWDFNFHDGTLSTWHLFGSRLNDRFFDLGWVRLVYWYGVIPAILILAAVFIMFRIIRKERDEFSLMLLTILVLFTTMEAHIVSEYLARNYLLILAAIYLPRFDLSGAIRELCLLEKRKL